MRTLAAGIAVFFVTIYSASLVIIARLLRRPVLKGGIYERAMRNWATAIVKAAGVKVVFHGEANIPEGGAVFICNHVSWFDVFAIASKLPRCTFVAKSELRGIPVFGWGAEAAGVVFLDRDNRKSAFESYKVAALSVQAGRRIVVFPEGTRGQDYHLRTFKKGPFVLAITAEAPLVPTVIYGAREVMGKGSFRVRAGEVHIHFLEPVQTKGQSYEERTALMAETHSRMDVLLESRYGVLSESANG
ncbi:MAG TPA: lysophospholipid acyltransferase family protein [Gemmatimonadaceae bacterium]|nr:lysophospholipid acyltransferase family protein [Gemmatimonadaceae bacterium]